MFFLPGVAGFLFVPMAKAVMFAMIASFILSRTLVPTMAMYLLQAACPAMIMRRAAEPTQPLVRFQRGFEPASSGSAPAMASLLEHGARRAASRS
jgi:multidrug efflux pump subunit AcrB